VIQNMMVTIATESTTCIVNQITPPRLIF